MSGDVMLEKLRAKSWGSNMRVIVLTNISKDEAPSKLRLLGVDRYIIKAHYTPSQIIEMVDGLMKPVPKNS
jgi:DNA-binding NarL/FixJ family response regulator